MIKRIKTFCQVLTILTFLLLYVTLEVTVIRELGWQGGLVATFYFTIFGLLSFTGLTYRPPFVDSGKGENEDANCRP